MKVLPAFPLPLVHNGDRIQDTADYAQGNMGLSKREYFAAKAMQGMLANTNLTSLSDDFVTGIHRATLASTACAQADALIKELES